MQKIKQLVFLCLNNISIFQIVWKLDLTKFIEDDFLCVILLNVRILIVKLLGITIDNQLKFDRHIKNMCKEAGKKINALARIAPYLKENKRKTFNENFCFDILQLLSPIMDVLQ